MSGSADNSHRNSAVSANDVEYKALGERPTLTRNYSSSTAASSLDLAELGTPASRHVTAGSEPPSSNVSYFRIVFDDVLLTPEVLDHPYHGNGTEDDPYVAEFIPNDPRNPLNWPDGRKWGIAVSVSLCTFVIAFCSSAYSGAVKQLMEDFSVGQEVVTLGLSLFVFGYVVGPLLWGPLSELYGRRWLFIGTYAMLTVFNAGVAGANSMATVIVLRTFAGLFGSSPLTNAGGAIADMFEADKRGVAMAVFSSAPFLGPSVGPIVGGFAGESIGWRWVMGIMAILAGVFWITGICVLPETYAPVILDRRAKALSKATGKVFRTRMDLEGARPSPGQAFKTALGRPWLLLFREPIVLITAIYMAIVYGTLYMLFSAFPIVYQENRGWSEGVGGLAFIGVLVGMVIALIWTVPDNEGRYKNVERKCKARGEPGAPPEARLPPAIIGSVMLPVGLFWFAWTCGPNIHWSVSIIASAPFGAGMVLVFLAIMNYLIDSYTIYAASVLAANSVLRSLFGTAFPLFTTYMYDSLGIHWASTIPAFLALVCMPFPLLFYKYGERIRRKCKYAKYAAEQMDKMKANSEDEAKSKHASRQASRQASRSTMRTERAKSAAAADRGREESEKTKRLEAQMAEAGQMGVERDLEEESEEKRFEKDLEHRNRGGQ